MSKKFMDPLADLADSDESEEGSGSEDEGEAGGSGGQGAAGSEGPAVKRQKQQAIDFEHSERMFVPDKKDDNEQNWAWGSGEDHKGQEVGEESFGEREANRQAVTSKAEESGGTLGLGSRAERTCCWVRGIVGDGGQRERWMHAKGPRVHVPFYPSGSVCCSLALHPCSLAHLPHHPATTFTTILTLALPPIPLLSALYARLAVEQAEALRQQKREEQQRLKADKKLTWNQKEKRKRDEGRASRGKSYVEEEKRRAREFGIVSGFD
ncbi:hypothetical protein ABPG77_008690 [Micractinium sp. CCAP 211/92]